MPRRRPAHRLAPWGLGLLVLVFQVPFLERGVSFYDEGSILAIAEGLSRGEHLYRDRITNMGPLTYELMGLLMRVFGPHLLLGRVLTAVAFAVCAGAFFAILRRLGSSRSAWAGAAAFLVIKALAFPAWTMVNYSQVAMMFALVAVVAVLRYLASRRPVSLFSAGVLIGLTVVTKQNLGALVALSVATAVGVDLWRRRVSAGTLLVHGGIGFAGSVLPVALVLGAFHLRGSLGDLLDRTVLGLPSMAGPYAVPFPGLDLWAYRAKEIGALSLTYFPPVIVHLAWQGKLNLYSAPIVILIESAVKAVYYLPLAAFPLAILPATRRAPAGAVRSGPSPWVLLGLLSATSYLSLYRADWAHLMNAYPLMLLFLVAALARRARMSRAGRRIGTGLLAGWVAAGTLVGGAVFSVFRSPIETPRGRLLVPPSEAEYANRVLAYTATQDPERKIFFARADSLFYFLSARRMPTPFDLILPGLFLPGDDERMAESLSQVDQVIYNPTMLPSIPAPITDYLPRSSALLASRFRLVKMLHSTSLLMLRTREPNSRRRTRVDLWEAFSDLRPLAGTAHGRHGTGPERSRSPGKTSWLVYRVITLSARRDPPWSCFGFSDRVRAGDILSVLPMSDPRAWRPGEAAGGGSLLFEVYQQPLSGDPALLSSRRQPIHGLPEPLRIPLRNLAGRRVELQFCARLGPDAPPRPLSAGWGELHIANEGPFPPRGAGPVS